MHLVPDDGVSFFWQALEVRSLTGINVYFAEQMICVGQLWLNKLPIIFHLIRQENNRITGYWDSGGSTDNGSNAVSSNQAMVRSR